MPRLKLITFDLDNTLWDVEAIIIRAEADMLNWLRANAPDSLNAYTKEALPGLREQAVAAHPNKRHDLSFMRTEVLYLVMRAAGYPEKQARVLAVHAFEVFFAGRNNVQFFPGALELLDNLQSRYVLYALTNGNADIQRTGLDQYLAGAVSSADVGASKPHAAMFRAALDATSTMPHETVHVGDNLVDDIEGAANVGMHTVWVNLTDEDLSQANHQPSETVTALTQIEKAIDRLENL